jgi:hypothetical protein
MSLAHLNNTDTTKQGLRLSGDNHFASVRLMSRKLSFFTQPSEVSISVFHYSG